MQHSGMFTPTVAFVANGWRENMQFSNAHIYVGLFVLLLVVVSNAFSKTPFDEENTKFWKTQNTVGFRRQLFAWTRASIRSLYCVKSWIFEGYAKYSKSNAFFGIPTIDRGWLMVVPPRQIKKLYSLPDDVLDHHTTANNSIQTRWTIWDEAVSENDFQMNVIRNQITKNLDILTPTIALELEKGFEREWGTSSDWKPISVWTSALSLIAGAANGVFCGAPLCRDMEFLARLRDHAMALFIGAIMINSTPRPFRFVTGNLVGWLCYILLQRVSARCLPFVRQRLGETAKLKANPDHDWVPPKDGLQWIIDECYATGDPSQLDPRRITHRLAFINDISMHSTSYTVQNLLLDLASSEPSLGYIEALREEASRVFHESGGSWTRQSVNKLKLIDSTIRESMRLSPFNSVGLPRTVIHPQGVNVQQGNTTLNIPSGTLVGIPVEAIHYDEAVYQDACTFRPFRFTEPDAVRDIIDATGEATYKDSDATDKAAAVPAKQKSSATIDDAFLGFGFGRHACPGRFFALNEIKIFIAHMVLHYDIQHITVPRQKMTPMIWLNVPFFKDLRVNIRRRTSSP